MAEARPIRSNRRRHSARRPPLAVALLLSVPGAVPAQGAPPACSFDTAAVTVPHAFTIGLAAAGLDLLPAAGPPEGVRAAEAIAGAFVPPPGMSLPLWARIRSAPDTATPGAPAVGHGLDDFIELDLAGDGRLATREIDIRTASPEFNASLTRAILAVDSARGFPNPGPDITRSGGRITLRLVGMSKARVEAYPLMRVRLPMVQAESNARPVGYPSPAYPRDALRAGLGDSLAIQYVVDASGAVDVTAPFHLLRVRFRPFAESVIASLREGRFEPARAGGCPVPQLVSQPFIFEIRRQASP